MGEFDIVIPANRRRNPRQFLMYAGQVQDCTIDYSPWAEEHGNVTAVTMTLVSGDCSVSGNSLASNVESFILTTANAGPSLIKISATAGNNTHVFHIYVYVRDPSVDTDDYGLFP